MNNAGVGLGSSFLDTTLEDWDWILGISPLWHVPNVTDPSASVVPVVGLTLIAIALAALGFLGFQRRDVL